MDLQQVKDSSFYAAIEHMSALCENDVAREFTGANFQDESLPLSKLAQAMIVWRYCLHLKKGKRK